MTQAYSLDLRAKIIEAYKNNEGTQKEIAGRFKVGIATVGRYWQKYTKKGTVELTIYCHGPKPVLSGNKLERVKELVISRPDATLEELCRLYNKNRKIKVGKSMMGRACQKLGFRFKKKSLYAQECKREDIKKRGKNIKKK